MDTRRTTARRVEEEVANAGATPQGNRIPCQEKVVVNDQVPINPPAMTDGEVRASVLKMAQAITTKALDIAAQANGRSYLEWTNMLVLWLPV